VHGGNLFCSTGLEVMDRLEVHISHEFDRRNIWHLLDISEAIRELKRRVSIGGSDLEDARPCIFADDLLEKCRIFLRNIRDISD